MDDLFQRLNRQAAIAPALPGVYGLFNFIDNAYYVGSSINVRDRLKYHIHELRRGTHYNRILQKRWNSTEESDWLVRILELCPASERLQREQHFIDFLLSHFEGYNQSSNSGHPKAYEWTLEQRQRHSLVQLERYRRNPVSPEEKARLKKIAQEKPPLSAEARKRIAHAVSAREYSLETLKNMSAGQKRRFRNGMPLSTKRKISKANANRVFTTQHRKHVSEGQARRWAKVREARG